MYTTHEIWVQKERDKSVKDKSNSSELLDEHEPVKVHANRWISVAERTVKDWGENYNNWERLFNQISLQVTLFLAPM